MKKHYPYDYRWRRYQAPAALEAAGGHVVRGQYRGGARCALCRAVDLPMRRTPDGKRWMQVAHLDGNVWNREPWNLAPVCPTPCHHAHDYPQTAARLAATAKAKARRKNDARRELLALMTAPAVQMDLLEGA